MGPVACADAVLAELRAKAANAARRNKPTMWAYFVETEKGLREWFADVGRDDGGYAGAALALSQIAQKRCPTLLPGDAARLWALGVYARRILATWGAGHERVSLAWLHERAEETGGGGTAGRASNRLLVLDAAFPTIVGLCGSTRFWREFQRASLSETMAGRIVLSIGAASGTDDEHFGNLPREQYDAVKTDLDELHKRKIDLADEVLVLNVGGYVGKSTASEIRYADMRCRPIRWLEPDAIPADFASIPAYSREAA